MILMQDKRRNFFFVVVIYLFLFSSVVEISLEKNNFVYAGNYSDYFNNINKNNNYFICNTSDYEVLWKIVKVFPHYGDISFIDLTGDDKQDVLIGMSGIGLFAIDGVNGSIIWTKNFTSSNYWFPYVWCYGANFLDIDNDNNPEIIVSVSGNHTTYAFERDSTEIWSYSLGKDKGNGNTIVGDTDNDNHPEIITRYSGGILILSPTNGTVLWNYESSLLSTGEAYSAVSDLNGDGYDDIIVTSAYGNILAINGKTRSPLWKKTLPKKDKNDEHNKLSIPSIGDVDGDGKLEVFVGSSENHEFYAIDGRSGKIIWNYMTGNYVVGKSVLGDLNCDGILDVIFTSDDGKLYVLDGLKGDVIWTFQFGKSLNHPDIYGALLSTPVIGDLNNDDRLDVLIGSCDGNYYVLDGKTGEVLWIFEHPSPIEDLDPVDVVDSGAIVDLDSDGENEVILVWSGLGVYAYDFHEGVSGKRIYWGTSRGNSLQQGSSLAVDQDNDLLSDYSETFFGTDKTEMDTDHDGLPDGYEVSCLNTSPIAYDSDNNGINDGDEDFDDDGLSNAQEYDKHTDPFIKDSDSDGFNDNMDLILHSNDLLFYVPLIVLVVIASCSYFLYKKIKARITQK
ncbi:MAG: FG-GAP-like repeat-containing protein [Candidatus Heimdallarchaeaceae archaeon]